MAFVSRTPMFSPTLFQLTRRNIDIHSIINCVGNFVNYHFALPHVPESSPVTGSANPSNEVYAVAISFPYADLISALVAVFAGMLNVKVVLVLLSEPKSSTAMARSALLAL